MKHISIRSSALCIPPIGIGCMRIAGMQEAELDTFVKTAMDLGLCFFDHADILRRREKRRTVRQPAEAGTGASKPHHPAVQMRNS